MVQPAKPQPTTTTLVAAERAEDPLELDLETLRAHRGEKWRRYPEDVLPAWVAELDFALAAPIRAAVESALQHHDLGYPRAASDTQVPSAFAQRMRDRYGWEVAPERVELLSDVVQGVYLALDRFTAPTEGVVVQTPIYPPFLSALEETGRTLVDNPLRPGADRYELDIEGLRRTADARTRMLLLCNPHNPTGRVLDRAELAALAALAEERDWVVVSDEIHADLVYPGATHIPFASLGPEAAARTVTLTSATKAFNVPGLRCAVAAFGSAALQDRFNEVPHHQRGGLGSLGMQATVAAWRESQPWLDRVLEALLDRRNQVKGFAVEHYPAFDYRLPEASYLAWLDCRSFDLRPTPYRFFLDHARVALSPGEVFGAAGSGFVRLNFGTSRALLSEILSRMDEALRRRGR